MKDLVLEGFVSNFADNRGLTNTPTDTQFEAFCASAVLRRYHQAEIHDLGDVINGGGGDGAIDSIAILVNGTVTQTIEDVKYFSEKLKRLDVEFVFIQAKSGASFEASKIGSFLYGVEQFFAGEASLQFRQEIEALRIVKDYLLGVSINMDENPKCSAYYCVAGPWNDDHEPKDRLQEGKKRLDALRYFSSVTVEPIDAEKLKTIYRELERRTSAEIEFQKTASFPRIDGVVEAYVGLLPGDQFMKLILTDDGMLNRELFYDNVRDFQGDNPVNKEIGQTLQNTKTRNRFALLNNGVTIVARSVNRQGDRFRISDYQIVNGCQTTHMLFQNKDKIGPDSYIPLKLIVTDDSEIITEVIAATNRQTAVLPEALESLAPFHRDLEDFYNSQHLLGDREDNLYYERRSKQYAFERIHPTNIITLTQQTKSFVAMFLNEPHSHPRYYGELLKAYELRLFLPDHKPAPYYSAGLAFHTVEKFLSQEKLSRKYRNFRYHLIMLLRILTAGVETPKLNNNKVNDYGLKIINELRTEATAIEYCLEAQKILASELSKFEVSHGDISRLRAFTTRLLESVQKMKESSIKDPNLIAEPQIGKTETGTIRFYNEWKEFGFIERDAGGDLYVHRRGLLGVPWQKRVMGTRVEYAIVDGRLGPKAEDVRLIKSN